MFLLFSPLSLLSQARYQLGFSGILSLHIISVNMSALSHFQVGDKEDKVITEITWLSNLSHMSTSTCWWANCDKMLGKPKRCFCKVRQMMTLDIMQYSYSIMTGSATLCWLYKLYCSGRLKEVHRGNGCSYRVCTEMVLQWHCLLCSTAIDCCSTGVTVALSAVQYSDRLLFYRCYSGTVCCAVLR